jgi:hypothetical protein
LFAVIVTVEAKKGDLVMRRVVCLLTVAGVFVAMSALAGPAAAQTADDPAMEEQSPTVLTTDLTGEEEVPGPGDPDGSGSAHIVPVSPEAVCFVLTASGIEPAAQAHIHEAPPGEAGPIVLPLTPPTNGASGGCSEADPALVGDLRQRPSDFYVNVHNDPYPDGAIRGQLPE